MGKRKIVKRIIGEFLYIPGTTTKWTEVTVSSYLLIICIVVFIITLLDKDYLFGVKYGVIVIIGLIGMICGNWIERKYG